MGERSFVFIVTAGVSITRPLVPGPHTDYYPGFGPRNHRMVRTFYSWGLCRSCILRPPSWSNLSGGRPHLSTSHPQKDANLFFVSNWIGRNLRWSYRPVHDWNDCPESRNIRPTSYLYRIIRHHGSNLVDVARIGEKIRVDLEVEGGPLALILNKLSLSKRHFFEVGMHCHSLTLPIYFHRSPEQSCFNLSNHSPTSHLWPFGAIKK